MEERKRIKLLSKIRSSLVNAMPGVVLSIFGLMQVGSRVVGQAG